jgi:hypothetical protein
MVSERPSEVKRLKLPTATENRRKLTDGRQLPFARLTSDGFTRPSEVEKLPTVLF